MFRLEVLGVIRGESVWMDVANRYGETLYFYSEDAVRLVKEYRANGVPVRVFIAETEIEVKCEDFLIM